MAIQNGTMQHVENGLLRFAITGLLNGNQTPALDLGLRAAELSFSVAGTLGAGGSVQMEASDDGASWTLQGAAVTAVGATHQRTHASRYVRFNVTAGDGATSFNIVLTAHPARG